MYVRLLAYYMQMYTCECVIHICLVCIHILQVNNEENNMFGMECPGRYAKHSFCVVWYIRIDDSHSLVMVIYGFISFSIIPTFATVLKTILHLTIMVELCCCSSFLRKCFVCRGHKSIPLETWNIWLSVKFILITFRHTNCPHYSECFFSMWAHSLAFCSFQKWGCAWCDIFNKRVRCQLQFRKVCIQPSSPSFC